MSEVVTRIAHIGRPVDGKPVLVVRYRVPGEGFIAGDIYKFSMHPLRTSPAQMDAHFNVYQWEAWIAKKHGGVTFRDGDRTWTLDSKGRRIISDHAGGESGWRDWEALVVGAALPATPHNDEWLGWDELAATA